MLRLEGVFPPLATPFKHDELDVDALKRNIRKYNAAGLSGYLVLGSNGEGVYLNEKEKRLVLEAAREVIPEHKVYMAGVGQESTRETKRWVRIAADAGADCALIVTPHFYKGMMTSEALKKHYGAIAESAPIPILVYNVPQFTGINLSPSVIEDLAGHENIVGIKDSSGNIGQLAEIIRRTPSDFAVFVGSAPVFFPALCVGAVGGILAVANVIPETCVSLHNKVKEGKFEEAKRLQYDLIPLARWVTTKRGIGGLKMAMDEMGYEGGAPRQPLRRPVEEREDLEKLLVPFLDERVM